MSRDARPTLFRWCALSLVHLPISVALLGCGGGEEKGPVTAASSSFRVADENQSAASKPAAATVDDIGQPSVPAATDVSATADPASPAAPTAGSVPTPPVMPPLGTAPAAESYKVPESAEDLAVFLGEMQRRCVQEIQAYPPTAIPPEVLTDCRRIQQARLEAAEKLLGLAKEAKAQFAATQSKLDAMGWLARFGDRQTEKELHALCRKLMDGQDKNLAVLGRLTLFGQAMDSLANGKVQDVQPIVAELKSLIAESPKEDGVFIALGQAAVVLQGTGHEKEAMEAFRAIGAAFKDHATPQIASQAQLMLLQAKQVELGLPTKVSDLLAGKPDSAKPVVEAVTTLFQGEKANQSLFGLGSEVGHMLEACGFAAEAGQVFGLVETAFKDYADKDLADQAVQRAQNARLRAALVGQPFVVEGTTVDGAPFDWNVYKGKVVLVDFWATWCMPCLNEVPNIARAYKAYRERGFEVVGVNLDDDLESVQQFFAVQSLPWTTVVSPDPNARGFKHPLAVECGVDGIPFLVLVDRDGKVAALHVRGPKLEEKLAQMLGPASPETAAPATSTTPPDLEPPAKPPAAKPAT